MPDITNSETLQYLQKLTDYQGGIPPKKLGDVVIPVLDIARLPCRIVKNTSSTVTGYHTILEVDPKRDFYLCGINARMQKDAACDAATGYVAMTFGNQGASVWLYLFEITTATAEQKNVTIAFPNPILIDRTQWVQSLTAFTAGVCNRGFTIWGFYI